MRGRTWTPLKTPTCGRCSTPGPTLSSSRSVAVGSLGHRSTSLSHRTANLYTTPHHTTHHTITTVSLCRRAPRGGSGLDAGHYASHARLGAHADAPLVDVGCPGADRDGRNAHFNPTRRCGTGLGLWCGNYRPGHSAARAGSRRRPVDALGKRQGKEPVVRQRHDRTFVAASAQPQRVGRGGARHAFLRHHRNGACVWACGRVGGGAVQ